MYGSMSRSTSKVNIKSQDIMLSILSLLQLAACLPVQQSDNGADPATYLVMLHPNATEPDRHDHSNWLAKRFEEIPDVTMTGFARRLGRRFFNSDARPTSWDQLFNNKNTWATNPYRESLSLVAGTHLYVYSGRFPASLAAEILQHPAVAHVEPNQVHTIGNVLVGYQEVDDDYLDKRDGVHVYNFEEDPSKARSGSSGSNAGPSDFEVIPAKEVYPDSQSGRETPGGGSKPNTPEAMPTPQSNPPAREDPELSNEIEDSTGDEPSTPPADVGNRNTETPNENAPNTSNPSPETPNEKAPNTSDPSPDTPSNEAPDSSNESPSSPDNKVPDQSNESPDSSSNEIPDSSDESSPPSRNGESPTDDTPSSSTKENSDSSANPPEASKSSKDSAQSSKATNVPSGELRTQKTAPWGLARLSQKGQGSMSDANQPYKYRATGKGGVVYVLDTGVNGNHKEFQGRVRMGPDFTGTNGRDDIGHGTHVAGIAAGSDVGVAKDAEIVSVKVFSEMYQLGSLDTFLRAVEWVIQDHKKNGSGKHAVINYSGGGKASNMQDEAIRKALQSGIMVVSAAGNGHEDACQVFPANAKGARGKITVANVDHRNRPFQTTNYGSCVDVYAPGVNIMSSSNQGSENYVPMTGTSMSTPYVAGLALYFWELNPKLNVKEMYDTIVNADTGVIRDNIAQTPNKMANNKAV